MTFDFDEVNRILAEMHDEGMIEPIDDSSVEVDFWDWADVVGVTDDVVDQLEEEWYVGQELVDENGNKWYVS